MGSSTRHSSGNSRRSTPVSCRPSLETLEDRTVPSGLTKGTPALGDVAKPYHKTHENGMRHELAAMDQRLHHDLEHSKLPKGDRAALSTFFAQLESAVKDGKHLSDHLQSLESAMDNVHMPSTHSTALSQDLAAVGALLQGQTIVPQAK